MTLAKAMRAAKRSAMTPEAADRDPPPPPSLVGRALERLHRRPRAVEGSAVPVARPWLILTLALLIAAGPVATIAGATLLTRAVVRETAVVQAASAPRLVAARQQEAARAVLATAMARPGPAALLDALAPALPADAALVRAEQRADGTLEIALVAGDPDALRSAVRRVPALAGLRDVRQQESDGRTSVTLRQAGQ